MENEYLGASFALGQVRSISGYLAVKNVYDISSKNKSKWENLLILFLMAVGYRVLVFVLLQIFVRKKLPSRRFFHCNKDTNNPK